MMDKLYAVVDNENFAPRKFATVYGGGGGLGG